jgi:hypothetical protein
MLLVFALILCAALILLRALTSRNLLVNHSRDVHCYVEVFTCLFIPSIYLACMSQDQSLFDLLALGFAIVGQQVI